MEDQKYLFHSFHLPEEKKLHIVLRGIPTNFPPEEVKAELEELGFHPSAIYRVNMSPNRRPIPLVLVILPKAEKEIIDTRHILGLEIKVESLKNKNRVSECRNCQKFGHRQAKCTAPPVCMKCAEPHHTSTFNKPRELPAKCSNCGGEDPSMYTGCPQQPNNIQKKNTDKKRTTLVNQNTSCAKIATSPLNNTTYIPNNSPRQSSNNQTNLNVPNPNEAILSIQKFAQQISLLPTQLNQAFAPFIIPNPQQHQND